MFHSHAANSRITRLREICIRVTYNDKTLSFENLLEKDKFVTLHTGNFQNIPTEMSGTLKNISPPIVVRFFKREI